jgi:hypothetical protein
MSFWYDSLKGPVPHVTASHAHSASDRCRARLTSLEQGHRETY